ncbi:ATP-dependent DNA helicase RecQ-like [Diadema antillarum]|uniref:ATP-dependent DNA helicase RecQ-like n=1 Tax=Diadema antillarum TaxID=105358 RepID=UPI003A844A97
MVEEILELLHMKRSRINISATVPDRPNIHLAIHNCSSRDFTEYLYWYLELLKANQERTPKAIIYARNIDHVAEIWAWINMEMGFKDADERICEMYHGSSDTNSQLRITESFRGINSRIRCVVATVAFGLGINVPDVEFVLHFGVPSDILSYWQEVGRAGRDGRTSQAHMYIFPGALNSRWTDEQFIDLINAVLKKTKCFRKGILEYLTVKEMRESIQSGPAHSCCSVCDG